MIVHRTLGIAYILVAVALAHSNDAIGNPTPAAPDRTAPGNLEAQVGPNDARDTATFAIGKPGEASFITSRCFASRTLIKSKACTEMAAKYQAVFNAVTARFAQPRQSKQEIMNNEIAQGNDVEDLIFDADGNIVSPQPTPAAPDRRAPPDRKGSGTKQGSMVLMSLRSKIRAQSADPYVTKESNRRWPNARVPFKFQSIDSNNFGLVSIGMKGDVTTALKNWQRSTCVFFEEVFDQPTVDTGALLIVQTRTDTAAHRSRRVCSAHIGYNANKLRVMTLSGPLASSNVWAKGCPLGSIVHEAGHVLGLAHSHQRHDRDKYITVDQNRIDTEMKTVNGVPTTTRKFTDVNYGIIGDKFEDSRLVGQNKNEQIDNLMGGTMMYANSPYHDPWNTRHDPEDKRGRYDNPLRVKSEESPFTLTLEKHPELRAAGVTDAQKRNMADKDAYDRSKLTQSRPEEVPIMERSVIKDMYECYKPHRVRCYDARGGGDPPIDLYVRLSKLHTQDIMQRIVRKACEVADENNNPSVFTQCSISWKENPMRGARIHPQPADAIKMLKNIPSLDFPGVQIFCTKNI